MFSEVHTANNTSGPKLAFIKSLNIQAFPCGRRRSEEVDFDDQDLDGLVKDVEKYYIPYDPESRLNTESNNRQHTSINGFAQSFIKSWSYTDISMSIGGYLFKIKPQYRETLGHENEYDAFGKTLLEATGETGSSIYANIRIESVPLYSGFTTYYTNILRDQTTTLQPSASIDILLSDIKNNAAGAALLKRNPEECFYFAGLSFSVSPLTGGSFADKPVREVDTSRDDGSFYQKTISLRILDLVDGVWQLHQPALLPDVTHGPVKDSVKLGTVYADHILRDGVTVPSMFLSQVAGTDTYRLKFSPVAFANTAVES